MSSPGIYEGDYDKDFEKFAGIGIVLTGKEWFLKYCNKWLYTNPEEGIDDAYKSLKECNLCL